jgi:hypothetical protein
LWKPIQPIFSPHITEFSITIQINSHIIILNIGGDCHGYGGVYEANRG